MRFPKIAVLLVAILVAPAAAQQSANPVTAHYRAYRAALERGDLVTAETESTAALEAAQLDPHNVGRVAALALNAALVRLSAGHRTQALAPAQLAAALASNAQSNVDPMVVGIAVKRASLQLGDQSEAELLAALNTAQAHGGLDEYVYDGSSDLGLWATQQDDLTVAISAWELASRASPGDTDVAILSRADALIGRAIAMFRLEMETDPGSRPRQSAPLPLSPRGPTGQANVEVYRVLFEAASLLRPLALRAAPDGSMTRAQIAYARAIAFLRADYSRLYSFNQASNLEPMSTSIRLPAHVGANLCEVRPVARPMPTYPPAQELNSHVATVVVRFVIDGSGRVTDARVVTSVGGDTFEQSVAAVIGRWRVERASGSPSCEMAMTLFVPINFVI
jgi:TonB family protein